MHMLCGRGLHSPKMSERQEVELRLNSVIERTYKAAGDLQPTKDGWYRLMDQCNADICKSLYNVEKCRRYANVDICRVF